MVEHIQLHEEFPAGVLAVPPNPLREQYALSMTGGGGPGQETVQAPANGSLLNGDGTLTVPALNTSTSTRQQGAEQTTVAPNGATNQTTDKSGGQTPATGGDNQVDREYNAGLAMMQNPNGGAKQLVQTLGQFGPTPGSDPAYKAWAAGYTPEQIQAAYLQAQLAAGPMVGLYARLNQSMPSVAQAIAKVTEQYNQQVQAGAGATDGTSTTTPTDQQTDPSASQADPADTTAADTGQQPVADQPGTQAQLRPAVLRIPQSSAQNLGKVSVETAQQNFISQEQSNWNPNASQGNKDCGPTSLAMALKNLGVVTEGQIPQSAEALVSGVRQDMTTRDNHQENTNLAEIATAASKYGVQSQLVQGLDGINAAIANGAEVIAPGNPAYGWGPRLGNNYETVDGQTWSGAHQVLIDGIDQQTGKYIVSDPLSKAGVIEVTPQEMQNYIAHAIAPPGAAVLHGGLALYKPGNLNTSQSQLLSA